MTGGLPGGWSSTGQVTTNPTFVNAGTRDFHLQSGSPCINTGYIGTETTIYPGICKFANPNTNNIMYLDRSKYHNGSGHVLFDYDGRVRNTLDIGAFEY
jgi:hypothetical protein